ncbi:MAG: PIG-L family deacetylase [Acidimicrobiia bacterium]|nr:PIG-L family deacetylase [Acidimicrobiia bacterium]MBV8983902.1 PIG-L family deacetylase [Acidimicrobiia bacterium]MBV9040589.1 PIG-L family deacetylase [Acidimicrobiia bacterium]
MAELVDAIPARVLGVYAHPDDPEISCGGTLARWAQGGAEVHVLICTRGEKGSPDPNQDPDELAATRREEMSSAAEVLGLAGHRSLENDDGELENTAALRRNIVSVIREVRPQIVVCPDPTAVFFGNTYYNHHDHRATGWATLDAVAPAAGNPHYFPDAGPVHHVAAVYLSGTMEPDAWIDISDTLDVKVEALFRHASQLTETGEFFRTFLKERAEEAGRAAGVRYAEGFRRLTLFT